MSSWKISYFDEALQDYYDLEGSIRPQVAKLIQRVSKNPLPQREGGFGHELGHKNGTNLAGCLKIKLKKAGIRIIYKLERTEQGMTVIIIGMRKDDDVYKEAARRLGR